MDSVREVAQVSAESVELPHHERVALSERLQAGDQERVSLEIKGRAPSLAGAATHSSGCRNPEVATLPRSQTLPATTTVELREIASLRSEASTRTRRETDGSETTCARDRARLWSRRQGRPPDAERRWRASQGAEQLDRAARRPSTPSTAHLRGPPRPEHAVSAACNYRPPARPALTRANRAASATIVDSATRPRTAWNPLAGHRADSDLTRCAARPTIGPTKVRTLRSETRPGAPWHPLAGYRTLHRVHPCEDDASDRPVERRRPSVC
jgi:hypothetical protein